MKRLERHRGHFYNWYDTRSLRPAQSPATSPPWTAATWRAICLTLRPGLIELLDRPILEPRWLDGLGDTLGILEAAAGKAAAGHAGPVPDRPRCRPRVAAEHAARRRGISWNGCCHPPRPCRDLPGDEAPETEALWWARALVRQCRALRDELAFLAPWTDAARSARRAGRPPRARWDTDAARPCGARCDSCQRVSRAGRPRSRRRERDAWLADLRRQSGKAASAPGSASRRSSDWPCRRKSWPTWSTGSCTTRARICSPSATTSTSGGGTRATTTCWPRRRAWPFSSPSPRGSFRRSTGSPWGACSPARAARRSCSPGAARCSST